MYHQSFPEFFCAFNCSSWPSVINFLFKEAIAPCTFQINGLIHSVFHCNFDLSLTMLLGIGMCHGMSHYFFLILNGR